MKIVAFLSAHHKASCAMNDPSPSRCDCHAKKIPLVTLDDATAAVAAALASPAVQVAAVPATNHGMARLARMNKRVVVSGENLGLGDTFTMSAEVLAELVNQALAAAPSPALPATADAAQGGDLHNVISNAIYGYGEMLEDHEGVVDAIVKAIEPACGLGCAALCDICEAAQPSPAQGDAASQREVGADPEWPAGEREAWRLGRAAGIAEARGGKHE